ncbi:DoxX family protein [Nesterenkonia sp. NBAIMH1]|uniref:DoxX family protein n=1 Tax=Nesterenkonia sp. NBAIMH1 TaxID=2600320 RepID=UPI00143E0090|nr:DoxX family protein [Nesterenkonia sp. NBAIMH1]
MSLVRKAARPLLGAVFIANGVDRLRNADEAAEQLKPVTEEVASIVPQAEAAAQNPKMANYVIAGVEITAGTALAIGKFPRLSALALAKVHALEAYAEYRTASLETSDDVTAQRKSLVKNLGILGGLGLASVDLNGKPSLAWRAEHIAKSSKKKGARFGEKTVKRAEGLGADASKALKSLENDAKKQFKAAEKKASQTARSAAKKAEKAANTTKKRVS